MTSRDSEEEEITPLSSGTRDSDDKAPSEAGTVDEDEEDVLLERSQAAAQLPVRGGKKKIEAFEIDSGPLRVTSDDEGDEEQARLIRSTRSQDEDEAIIDESNENDQTAARSSPQQAKRTCFSGRNSVEKVGNVRIFCPSRYYQTGWGCAGPDWYGPPTVAMLIAGVTYGLVIKSQHADRPYTAAFCILFSVFTVGTLLNAAYRDPGLVRARREAEGDWLWCDFCSNAQPPGGAHCPSCNVCVAGYDHHCVWMGSCVGRNNFRAFVRFNLTWMAYAAYAVVWVIFLGPLLEKLLHHGKGGDANSSVYGGDF